VVEIPENWVSICEDEVISGSTTLYRLYQSSSFEIHRNDNAIDLQRNQPSACANGCRPIQILTQALVAALQDVTLAALKTNPMENAR
jgi:hypothetical protein